MAAAAELVKPRRLLYKLIPGRVAPPHVGCGIGEVCRGRYQVVVRDGIVVDGGLESPGRVIVDVDICLVVIGDPESRGGDGGVSSDIIDDLGGGGRDESSSSDDAAGRRHHM